MLHSRLVRYIDVVAREGSFHKAAEVLNVATSAISRQITNYEKALGVQIFERQSRGLRLTSAGETVLAHIRETLAGHESLNRRLEEMKGLKSGSIKIVTAAGIASALLPRLVARFCAEHPRVEFLTLVRPIDEIIARVASGSADLGLAFDPMADQRISTLARIDLSLGLVTRPDDPLCRLGTIRLSDCANLELLLPDRSLTLRQQIDHGLSEGSLSPKIRAVSDSVDFLKRMVIEGAGVTILSYTDVLNEVRQGTLTHLPFSSRLPRNQVLSLIAARHGVLEPMPASFAEAITASMVDDLSSHRAP